MYFVSKEWRGCTVVKLVSRERLLLPADLPRVLRTAWIPGSQQVGEGEVKADTISTQVTGAKCFLLLTPNTGPV
jgi:hypothetical protein